MSDLALGGIPLHSIDPAQKEKEHRERFIMERTMEEEKFDRWYRNVLLTAPKEQILDKIPFDYSDMSIKTMIPEWFVDKPNPEVANQQVDEFQEKLNIIMNIFYEANKESIRLQQEFDAISSGR